MPAAKYLIALIAVIVVALIAFALVSQSSIERSLGSAFSSSTAITSSTPTSKTCSESDNGINDRNKATTILKDSGRIIGQSTDYCIDKNYLMEYYCREIRDASKVIIDRKIGSKKIFCNFACKNGACVWPDPNATCVDTDSGEGTEPGLSHYINPYVSGSATRVSLGFTTTLVDRCHDQSVNPNVLSEVYCTEKNELSTTEFTCTYGCVLGACLTEAVTPLETPSQTPTPTETESPV